MKRIAASLVVLALFAFGAAATQAATFDTVKATWGDTNLPPGGEGQFTVQARNIGSEDFAPGLTITDELPAGVTATKITWGPNTVYEVFEQCEAYSAWLNAKDSSACHPPAPGSGPKR